MPKLRHPKVTPPTTASGEPTAKQIEDFAAGADGGAATLDPAAKRDHKGISMPFNEYEFDLLTKAAAASGRSKLGFIRWAMLEMAKSELN
jgi:hypothetical protein